MKSLGNIITEHVYIEPVWEHIISTFPLTSEIKKALRYARNVLHAQYGLYTNKCIQLSSLDTPELLTEAGVRLIEMEDLSQIRETLSDAYLISNSIYNKFSQFYRHPENFSDFDTILNETLRNEGLIYALVNPHEVPAFALKYWS